MLYKWQACGRRKWHSSIRHVAGTNGRKARTKGMWCGHVTEWAGVGRWWVVEGGEVLQVGRHGYVQKKVCMNEIEKKCGR